MAVSCGSSARKETWPRVRALPAGCPGLDESPPAGEVEAHGRARGFRGTGHTIEVVIDRRTGAGYHGPAGAVPGLDQGLMLAADEAEAGGRARGCRGAGDAPEDIAGPWVGAGHHRPAGAVPGFDEGPGNEVDTAG